MLFKFKIFILSIVSLLLISCGGGGDGDKPSHEPIPPKNILLIGDSLTDTYLPSINWANILKNNLKDSANIFNLAHKGESSFDAVNKIGDYLNIDADIVYIFIGTNDAFIVDNADVIENNIRTIMKNLNDKKARQFILVNLKYPETYRELVYNDTHNDTLVSNMEQIIPHILKDYPNSIFINNYFSNLNLSPEAGEMSSDGVHVTEKGQQIIFENMLPFFLQAIKDTSN